MSGFSSYAGASTLPPLYDATYDDFRALLNQIPDLATYLLSYFDAPPASKRGTDLYAYNSQAQVAADPRQDQYPSSVNMYGQPAAATLRDREVWFLERRPPSPGAHAAVPSTSAWSSPELTASVDVTSRSVTPASTLSSPWDSCDVLPVAGPGAFPTAVTVNLTNELPSGDAPTSLNLETPSAAAEPEAPATIVDASVARPRRRLARRRKADNSRWDVSGPEQQQQLTSKNVEAFNEGHLIWDANAPELQPEVPATVVDASVARRQRRLAQQREWRARKADDSRWQVSGPEGQQQLSSENVELWNNGHLIWDSTAPDRPTMKVVELVQAEKEHRRAGKRRADSSARGRRSQSRSSSSSHPEPPTAPASRAQTPAPPRGRRTSRAPPPPAPITAQDTPGPEYPSAPFCRPRASSSTPTRAPAAHATSRAPARSQSSAPALVHAQVYKPFEEAAISAIEDYVDWLTASEPGTPSDATDAGLESVDLNRSLADIQAGNRQVHEDFAAIEHISQREQPLVAGSALGLHFDPAYGALPSSHHIPYLVSSWLYASPTRPPPGRSSSSSMGTLPGRTHGPKPGQPSYWNTPLPSTPAPYDPHPSFTPHTPHQSYHATSNADAPVRNRKRRMLDDGFPDYGARPYDYHASR